MTTLTNFVLIGTIVSSDDFLSTIEFNLNPATNGGPSIAVLPNQAIPCDIKIGTKVYVVKNDSQEVPIITCEKEETSESR
tara:strand:- start:30 stop:269 length:240 start_codon:yes stop_codon:yes gene_type:complete